MKSTSFFALAVAALASIWIASSPVLAGGDPVPNDSDESGPSSEPSPIQDADEVTNGNTQTFGASGDSSEASLLIVPVDGEEEGTPGTEGGGDPDGDETF